MSQPRDEHDPADSPSSRPKTIPCPICRKPVDMEALGRAGSAFPFCSRRCRDVDLGRWLDGKYQIPVDEDANDTDELPPPPNPPRRR